MKTPKIHSIVIFLLLIVVINIVASKIFRKGIDKYFGMENNPIVLMIGHSEMMLGIDKQTIEKQTSLSIADYCREGCSLDERKLMLQQFFSSKACDSLKYVWIAVDKSTLSKCDLSRNSYKLFYPFITDSVMSNYIREKASYCEFWIHKVVPLMRYNDETINYALRGYRSDWRNYKFGICSEKDLQFRLSSNRKKHKVLIDSISLKTLYSMIHLCKKKHCRVLLLNMPNLGNSSSSDYMQTDSIFQQIANRDTCVYYDDLNRGICMQPQLFCDDIHLNNRGRQVATQSVLKSVIIKKMMAR